jgi:hypothetical protein
VAANAEAIVAIAYLTEKERSEAFGEVVEALAEEKLQKKTGRGKPAPRRSQSRQSHELLNRQRVRPGLVNNWAARSPNSMISRSLNDRCANCSIYDFDVLQRGDATHRIKI